MYLKIQSFVKGYKYKYFFILECSNTWKGYLPVFDPMPVYNVSFSINDTVWQDLSAE